MFHFDLGVPTFSEVDEDGFVGHQVDVLADGSSPSGCPAGELQTPFGFQCRALDPTVDDEGVIDPTQSGQMLFAWEASRLHVIPTQDPRVVAKLPALKKGESMVYGWRGQFVRCHDDGSISTFTTDDGTPSGKSVSARHAPTYREFSAPWGRERFDLNGYHLVTKSGGRLDIGPGGMPGPLAGSAACLSADFVGIDGGLVTLGNPALPQDKVALSTPTVAAIAALQVELTAIATYVAALSAAFIANPAVYATVAVAMGPPGAALATALTSVGLPAVNALELLVPAASVTAA